MIPKALVAICAFLIGGTGLVGFKGSVSPDEESFEIKYEVNCTQCDVVFRNEAGQPEHVTSVKKTWKHGFEGNKGQFVYVSATNEDGSETKVTIKRGSKTIVVGSSRIAEKTARAGLIL